MPSLYCSVQVKGLLVMYCTLKLWSMWWKDKHIDGQKDIKIDGQKDIKIDGKKDIKIDGQKDIKIESNLRKYM